MVARTVSSQSQSWLGTTTHRSAALQLELGQRKDSVTGSQEAGQGEGEGDRLGCPCSDHKKPSRRLRGVIVLLKSAPPPPPLLVLARQRGSTLA